MFRAEVKAAYAACHVVFYYHYFGKLKITMLCVLAVY